MAIRDLVKSISPSWLADGVAERFLYNFGLGMDAVLEKCVQGVKARMPTLADPSALPYIGADRLIPKGLTESDTSYAVRLQQAFDAWQLAGNPWTVLRQALGYVLAMTPAARTVADTYSSVGVLTLSRWDSYAAGADTTLPPTHELAVNFDWDSLSPTTGSWGWWRWWLILYSVSPNDWVHAGPTWGSGSTWGDTTISWGLDVPSSTIAGLRSIVRLFKGAHSWCHEIIISFDATLFDPAQPVGGSFNPDGYFGNWSKIVAGEYVPARFANARYCEGAAE